jgi:thiamine-monophosphate kinase
MKISDIGGEFALIRRVTGASYNDAAIIKGVGDDCAVLDYKGDNYLIVTTDMMVEGSHFSLKWFSPYQIGKKLMEVNVSDIVAMGGSPRYALISLALKRDTQVEFMDNFYRGLYESAGKHSVALIGGDTTSGNEMAVNLTLIGDADKNIVRYRSGAVPGDIICVTGSLGKSEAGLRLLMKGINGYTSGHLEPVSRLEGEGRAIARYSNAMIDVSDGLGSEIIHICEESGTGARIDYEKIPVSRDTAAAAESVSADPHDYALYGGEDFEIVFAIPGENIEILKKVFNDFTAVGEILDKKEGIYIAKSGKRMNLSSGYDHFAV